MEQIKTIDGKKYRYLKIGTGERKLLLLWGLASYKENVLTLVTNNFSDYTVLVPEYPYHNGFDDANFDFTSLRSIGDYLVPLLMSEKFSNFSAIGFSFGGLVLLDLAQILQDNPAANLTLLKMAIWASPILGDAGISDISKLLSNTYLKTPDERVAVVHSSGVLKKILVARGVRPLSPFWFKKYLQVIKSTSLDSLPKGVPQLFIFDPSDIIVSLRNATQARRLIEVMGSDDVKVVELQGGGHFGTKVGWSNVLSELKVFIAR